jgi:hypothetical protein
MKWFVHPGIEQPSVTQEMHDGYSGMKLNPIGSVAGSPTPNR